MDKRLLDALDNISYGLEELARSLESKETPKSATAQAIQSGDFGKQLQTISISINEIKANTQDILKNQETIIELSKQKEGEKTEGIQVGEDKKEKIERGVGTILMIAVAVLAIGSAFNLVGSVDVMSVIGLSLAITILSIAFEKVASLNLSLESAAIASGALVLASIALTISSYFLSQSKPISGEQFASLIVMSSAFAILSYGVKNMIDAFRGASFTDIITASLFIPIILPVISWAVSKSSEYLANTQPLGLVSFFGAIMTMGIFVVMSYGLRNIISAFKGMDLGTAALAAGLSSVIFIGFSMAIMASSHFLKDVQPLGLTQFFSAAMVSGIFVLLSFGLRQIITSFKGMDFKTAIVASLAAPAIFTGLSLAIMASSHFLKETADIDSSKMLNILLLGSTMAIVVSLMVLPIKLIDKLKLSPGAIAKGGLSIIALAGVIAASSQLLNLGNYEDFPDMDWITGVGLSLLGFGAAAIGLGLFVAGPQALVFAAGLVAILGVAGTIVATSKILREGNYNIPNMTEWAKSTALLFSTFAPIMVALGAVGLASSVVKFFGAESPWDKAKAMMLSIGDTIVALSFKLQKGSYAGGPDESWAKGTALAIGAFSIVYEAISKNNSFFGGGVSLSDMNDAITTISKSIVSSADFFASNASKFTGSYPSEQWSAGVGAAIGAFAPVYDLLMEKSGFWKSGKSVINDIKAGISGIAETIVSVAKIFSSDGVTWESYPDKKWSSSIENVVKDFTMLANYIDEEDVNYKKVLYTANKISSVAKILHDKDGMFTTSISPDYMQSLSKNMIDFNEMVKELTADDEGGMFSGLRDSASAIFETDPIVQIAKRISVLSESYDKLASSLINLSSSMKSLNITDFRDMVRFTGQMSNPESFQLQNEQTVGGDSTNQSDIIETRTQIQSVDNSQLEEKLDRVIELLTNIDRSTSSLNSVLMEFSGDSEDDPEGTYNKMINKAK